MFTIVLEDGTPSRRQLHVDGPRAVIGKDTDCEVQISGWRVSRRHAEIFVSNDRVFVRDLGSTFGTQVGESKVDRAHPVGDEDDIRIGGRLIKVMWGRAEATNDGEGASVQGCGTGPVESPAGRGGSAAPTRNPRDIGASGRATATSFAVAASRATPAPGKLASPSLDLDFLALRRVLQDRLISAFDVRRTDTHRMTDEELRVLTERLIRDLIGQLPELPKSIDRQRLLDEVRDEAIGLGPLETMLADPSITEIMVNRADEVFVERGGVLEAWPIAFTSDRAVQGIIERIVAPVGRRIDESSPMVDARLKDGSRVNAVIPPLALKGPSITIRKFSKRKLGSDDLVAFGSASLAMVDFMRVCVEQRKNVLISGGTGSGKTTLLNILSNFIPVGERIVTIEDAAELQLHHPNLVSMEARPPNIEGKGLVSIRELVKNALRMRPDRIVVGECRGGEALDMLQAMNTGHDGSLTTAHANSPRDMLARLEVMVLMAGMDLPVTAIREQVASAVDIIVQQSRFACGMRKVTNIVEVTGVESGKIQLQEVFAFLQTGRDADGKTAGRFCGRGVVPEFYEELASFGVPLDLDIFNDGVPGPPAQKMRRRA